MPFPTRKSGPLENLHLLLKSVLSKILSQWNYRKNCHRKQFKAALGEPCHVCKGVDLMFWVDLHQPGTKDTKGGPGNPALALWSSLETARNFGTKIELSFTRSLGRKTSREAWHWKKYLPNLWTILRSPSHPIHPIRLWKSYLPILIFSFHPIFPHKAIPIIPIRVIRGRGFLNCSWASSCRPRNIEIRPLASQRLSLEKPRQKPLKNGEICWEYITQHIFVGFWKDLRFI